MVGAVIRIANAGSKGPLGVDELQGGLVRLMLEEMLQGLLFFFGRRLNVTPSVPIGSSSNGNRARGSDERVARLARHGLRVVGKPRIVNRYARR